jgi:hypothetical protein
MSDLQDLIHKTSMDCLERGKQIERERIIKLLETVCVERGKSWGGYCTLPIDPEHCQECRATFDYIELIKGETK